jgi:predicted aconitase
MNFHPEPHGVTVFCERYTRRFPVCYGNPSDVFAASNGFVLLYTLHFKENEKRTAVVAKATVHKQGSVQRFKFVGRLEFSVGH